MRRRGPAGRGSSSRGRSRHRQRRGQGPRAALRRSPLVRSAKKPTAGAPSLGPAGGGMRSRPASRRVSRSASHSRSDGRFRRCPGVRRRPGTATAARGSPAGIRSRARRSILAPTASASPTAPSQGSGGAPHFPPDAPATRSSARCAGGGRQCYGVLKRLDARLEGREESLRPMSGLSARTGARPGSLEKSINDGTPSHDR